MSRSPPSGEDGRRLPGDRPHQLIQMQNLQRVPSQGNQLQAAPQGSRDATDAQMAANLPGESTYWDQPFHPSHQSHQGHHLATVEDHDDGGDSPIDAAALQFALPPEIHQPPPALPRYGLGSASASTSTDRFGPPTPYYDETPGGAESESDRIPLTSRPQPISGTLAPQGGETQPRDSFQTVSDLGNSPSRRENRQTRIDVVPRHLSSNFGGGGRYLAPTEYRRSRSPSTSGALYRAGSMVRAMSQRVVNISGESEIDPRPANHRSRSHADDDGGRTHHLSMGLPADTSYPSQVYPSPAEKAPEYPFPDMALPPTPVIHIDMRNPLRGKSLGIFSPENAVRRGLCNLLVHPWTEPIILMMIVLQTVLLAVEAAPNVFDAGNERPARWGGTKTDWALFGLFVIFTLEIVARIIVSGFFLNAAEYSTIDRQRGIKAAVADQYRAIFQPHRQKSVKGARQPRSEPSAFARSFTIMQRQTKTVEEQQRFQLARRAFLRHGFNRLDFVAVVSFWISFVLGINGLEKEYHIYIFKMLSCLRILRLLALTSGTAIILRSLKKAAPLLVRVAFLMSFFWLLFAIIGVQSFKASLSRQCVWLDPLDPFNKTASFTNSFTFCGGQLNNETGAKEPWMLLENPKDFSTRTLVGGSAKGFICPRGSVCLQQQNPFNGTVNFDNIFHSLELVFVIMSANTFSDLMYYTIDSDYTQAALFFGAGIMILMLWMTNLLIAVITSSFQVIREESKASAFTADEEPLMLQPSEDLLKRPGLVQRIYDRTYLFWILVIAVSQVAQMCRSATMSRQRGAIIDLIELVATVLLDVEIVTRLLANWRRFHRSWRNLFDLALAVATSVILIPPIRQSGQPYQWLTLFQVLRTYRIVMAVSVTRKLILLVLGNATGIGNLMLFVFLITFIMAIFAVQLFRGEVPQFDDDGGQHQVSFFSIYNSFLGMYQILSSENWTSILYSITASSNAFNVSWIGAIFLIGWFILSFFILVNMFIAVIQENFDVSEDEKRLEQVKAFLQRKELGKSSSNNLALSTIFTLGRNERRRDPLDYGPGMMEMLLKDAVVRDFLDDHMDPLQEGASEGQPLRQMTARAGDVNPGLASSLWGSLVSVFTSREPNPFYSNIRFDGPNDNLDPRQMARQAVNASAARRRAQREYLARHPTYNNSLFIFTPKNPIRRVCQRLVGPGRGSERFDGVEPNKIAWYSFSAFIYAVIVAMVILACVTTPLYQKEYRERNSFSLANWYVWTDLAFAGVFTAEAAIKVIADGFFWTPNAYYRSSWGVIDAVVLVTLWIYVGTLLTNDGAVSRAIGAFKALRALRLLNVSNSARDTFHSVMIWGLWKILGPAFVSISLLIPFAVFGLNLFNGRLVQCNDTTKKSAITSLNQCFGEYNSTPYNQEWPLLAPRVASNPYFNFDNFGASLFTLFQIVSQEGWIDVSFAVQSITGVGRQPIEFAAQGNAMFFVVFNLLATVFVLTLFISVFMRNYTEQTGVAFLTAEQRSWLELRKLLRQISPSKSSYDDSEKPWKKWCHKKAIEKRGKWYTTITFILVCHLLLLVCEFHQEPAWWTKARDLLFLAFIAAYIANVAIRIIGLGWTRFRRSSWDLYSLVAVTGAFVATSALLISKTVSETYVQLHKFFLVAIVLLVIPRNDALDQLFKTAAASLTTISNLLATWLIFFVIFAIAMTQTFSLTRFGANEASGLNLRTVPHALILLFRLSCGEGWNEIMEDFGSIEPPLCVEDANFFRSDCGSKPWARFLFVTWNILSMYIFVNLFVSLIYESFSYVYQRSSGLSSLDRDEIRRFKEAWRTVDHQGTGFISKTQFPRLLGELSGVFEMRIYDADDSVRQILEDVRQSSSGTSGTRHMSIGASAAHSDEVDIRQLKARLARIDVNRVRDRRRRFNIFYEEVRVSADPDRGISFTTVLMILAHYKIINDSKSLRLEEFLRRRARLQKVEEEVQRRVVLGFFETLYWSRRFQRHLESKRSARMTTVPQLEIPDILVDDEDDEGDGAQDRTGGAYQGTTTPTRLRAEDATSPTHHRRSWIGHGGDFPYQDSVHQHPLSAPRSSPLSPGHHTSNSAFSFEFQEPPGGQPSPGSPATGEAGINTGTTTGADVNRRPSIYRSPSRVQDMLDDSVWVDPIRRSATVRRSHGGGSYAPGRI